MDTPTLVTALVLVLLGLALGVALGVLWARRATSLQASAALPAALGALESRAASDAVVADGLRRMGAQMEAMDRDRASHAGELRAQVAEMARGSEALRRETGALSTALRRPQVRGRWGEMHLRRTVELAGLVDRCDFDEQVRLDDGALRPDLVVRLAGGRSVVVDAKVALEAFLDAGEADDADEHEAHLRRHARQLRTHVDVLAGKAYARSLPDSTELVLLFVPSEAALAAALEADRGLLEHAAERQVVLAGPTTLIALLRTVAHGWRQEALTRQAAEVQQLGRELHERLGTMTEHLDKVGRALTSAVTAWNAALGSLEGRVLVTARRFGAMGVVPTDAAGITSPRQVEVVARQPVEQPLDAGTRAETRAETRAARRPRSA